MAPSAVIFNGGVFAPASLRDRIVEVLQQWFDAGQAWQPLVLTNPSLDLAVAWGAAYFGWLKLTGGRRIGGGIARSYYIGIETGPAAVETSPGDYGVGRIGNPSEARSVLCVVPQPGVTLTLPGTSPVQKRKAAAAGAAPVSTPRSAAPCCRQPR